MCVVRLLRGIGLMPALICAAASFYLAAPSAATADECKSIEEVVALVEAQKGRVVRVLVGDQAQHWLDVVNHQPPETEFKGDRSMIAWVPDLPQPLSRPAPDAGGHGAGPRPLRVTPSRSAPGSAGSMPGSRAAHAARSRSAEHPQG